MTTTTTKSVTSINEEDKSSKGDNKAENLNAFGIVKKEADVNYLPFYIIVPIAIIVALSTLVMGILHYTGKKFILYNIQLYLD